MATGFDYAFGERLIVELPLDSTSADIEVGTAITSSGATSGYYKEVDAAAESCVGIAVDKVSSPSADGGAYVKVDISAESYYRVNPDSGTVSQSLQFKTCDIGADGRSADIDGSTTDNVRIYDYRTSDNTILVRIVPAAFTGVA